jgi:hypothetical protein
MLTVEDRRMLERTRDDLKENPGNFSMDCWATCIAGRMSRLETGRVDSYFISNLQPRMQPLFSLGSWPLSQVDAYCRPKNDRAKIGADVIDRFLAVDGDSLRFGLDIRPVKATPEPEPQLIPAFIPSPRVRERVARVAVPAALLTLSAVLPILAILLR